jgi:hypothetical protein
MVFVFVYMRILLQYTLEDTQKRDSGIKGRDERSREIEFLMTDDFDKIKPLERNP